MRQLFLDVLSRKISFRRVCSYSCKSFFLFLIYYQSSPYFLYFSINFLITFLRSMYLSLFYVLLITLFIVINTVITISKILLLNISLLWLQWIHLWRLIFVVRVFRRLFFKIIFNFNFFCRLFIIIVVHSFSDY